MTETQKAPVAGVQKGTHAAGGKPRPGTLYRHLFDLLIRPEGATADELTAILRTNGEATARPNRQNTSIRHAHRLASLYGWRVTALGHDHWRLDPRPVWRGNQ